MSAPMPACPGWCRVDHAAVYEEYVRECAAQARPIRTLGHSVVTAEAVRFVDTVTGRLYRPEVRVGDDTLTAAGARALLAQLEGAIAIVEAEAATGEDYEREDEEFDPGPLPPGVDGFGIDGRGQW